MALHPAGLARPFRLLHWGFWGTNASFALAMAAQQWFIAHEPPPGISPAAVTNLSIAAFCGFAVCYWWSLGVLARRTGRSAPLWIVAGLATLAIGFFVTYVLMWRNVRAARKGHFSST
jgi:hypothetical protein